MQCVPDIAQLFRMNCRLLLMTCEFLAIVVNDREFNIHLIRISVSDCLSRLTRLSETNVWFNKNTTQWTELLGML